VQQEDVNPLSHPTVQHATKASLLRTTPINILPSSISPFLTVQLNQPHQAAAVAPPVKTTQQPVTQINAVPAAPLDQAHKEVEFQRMGKLKYKIKGLKLPTTGELIFVSWGQPACRNSEHKTGTGRPAHTSIHRRCQTSTACVLQVSAASMPLTRIRRHQHMHLQA
jgi:hypothetical protein